MNFLPTFGLECRAHSMRRPRYRYRQTNSFSEYRIESNTAVSASFSSGHDSMQASPPNSQVTGCEVPKTAQTVEHGIAQEQTTLHSG
jgi:hypothetical protein